MYVATSTSKFDNLIRLYVHIRKYYKNVYIGSNASLKI